MEAQKVLNFIADLFAGANPFLVIITFILIIYTFYLLRKR